MREFGIREHAEADRALDDFTTLWRHGGSPLLRELIDADTIELLGGPLSHPFQPLLNPRLREFALREGLADASQRFAHTPTGIWAPECAYAPGMEIDYAAAGVGHFMVDGPSLHGDTALGRPVGDSDVIAFGRDLQVSYRVWSPKSGYPGHAAYRDFHTYDHVTGLKPARVTGRNVPSDAKAPYDPQRADARGRRPRRRLRRGGAPPARHRERTDRPARARDRRIRHRTVRPLVVRGPGVAGDACCARCPPQASGSARCPMPSPTGSPAARSNCRPALGVPARTGQVWSGEKVADLVQLNTEVVDTALSTVDKAFEQNASVGAPVARDIVADQILRETLLTVSSDWPFMVSKDSAADYARYRAHLHAHATREIAGALASGRREQAERLAAGWNRADGLFGALETLADEVLPDTPREGSSRR